MTRGAAATVAAVVIGRNEGERLVRCLASLASVGRVVYVDSGSSDGSVEAARRAGAEVVELDRDVPFTAARARNAGFARLMEDPVPAEFVQFVDGDCELAPGWIATAAAFLDARPEVAVVAGRLRERFPEATLWNRLADAEWNRPPGRTEACGGIALMRARAVAAAGGFDARLIAGEEPELCYRMRQAGWEIWRLEAEMALHDAAMTRFSQWWRRSRRSGHAYAEGAALHGREPGRYNVDRERRSLLWGAGVPLAALLGSLVTPWALLILLAWPAQVVRLARRSGDWTQAFFLTLGKVAEAQGAIGYRLARFRNRTVGLIEYK